MNSVRQKYGRTFPLHLPPIDWYFVSDDSPEYPMVFYIELEFSGQLDRERFACALEESLERHPLLYSIVQPAKQNKPCWVPVPDQMPTIDWADETTPLDFHGGEYIDIRKTTGLRIWARASDNRTRMTMQFHHATTDGTGAYRFIGDLIGCYMKRLASCADKVELGVFDAAQLKVRRTKMRSMRADDSALQKFWSAISEAKKQFSTRVAALKTPALKPAKRMLPGIVNEEFSNQQLAALRKSATSRGATLNDLMLGNMFQTVRQWNGDSGRRSFRILVPSDMRDGQDFEIPACNMTAYTFISARSADIDNEQALLDRIRKETLEIKNGNLQKSFIDSLTTAMVVPFLLPMVLKRNVCLATGVLSNAGDPSRRFTCRLPKNRGKVGCDEFTLEGISGVPPLRRKTHCTLSTSIYGRKLTFSMRCSPQFFSLDDTRKLLDLFCERLRPLAQ